jgi:hypothetical protein
VPTAKARELVSGSAAAANDSAQQLTTLSRPNFRKRNSFSRLVDVSRNVNFMDANFVILALFALGLAGRCTTMVALWIPPAAGTVGRR